MDRRFRHTREVSRWDHCARRRPGERANSGRAARRWGRAGLLDNGVVAAPTDDEHFAPEAAPPEEVANWAGKVGQELGRTLEELEKRRSTLLRMHNQPGWIPYDWEVLDRTAIARQFPEIGPEVVPSP